MMVASEIGIRHGGIGVAGVGVSQALMVTATPVQNRHQAVLSCCVAIAATAACSKAITAAVEDAKIAKWPEQTT